MFGLLALLIRHDIHIYFGYYPTRLLVYWLTPLWDVRRRRHCSGAMTESGSGVSD